MNTHDLFIILLALMAACLLFTLIKSRKIKNEPILCEKVVIHSKSPVSNRFDSLFTMEFRALAQDAIFTCKVPGDIWNCLEVGDEGTLYYKGCYLHSFERNGETLRASYSSGAPV